MKQWYVNMGVYAGEYGAILDCHVVIWAHDAEDAMAIAKVLYPKAILYYATQDTPS